MFYKIKLSLSLLLFASLLTLLTAVNFVFAATVTQVIRESNQLCSDGIRWQCVIRIKNPQVTVKYHAQIRNLDTGAVLACNPSNPVEVLKGDRFRLEFLPHAYTDLSWFAAGWTWDSPYGTWRSGASRPSTYCPSTEYVSRTWLYAGRYGWVAEDTYVALSVNPPSKSVSGYSKLSCSGASSDGSRTCTAVDTGRSDIRFNFSSTYGEFYGSFFNHLGRGWNSWYGCHGNNTAMKNFRQNWGSFFGGGTYYYWPVFSGSRWDYRLNIPAQHIDCPINIISPNTRPAKPSVSAVGECNIGTAVNLSVSATDPDGDDVYYGIDWNNSGVYAWSGSAYPEGVSQTFPHEYINAEHKIVKVVAKDSLGLISEPETVEFDCVIPNKEPDAPVINSVSECVVGENTSVEIQGSDPDGDRIRFGVDWGDGVVDWVPGDGAYINSGGVVTAVNQFSGTKTISVFAEDEKGALSNSITHTVNCVVHHPPSKPIVTPDGACFIHEAIDIGARATDEDAGDTIRYGFDWDKDGLVDEWTDYGQSNEPKTVTKTWNNINTYNFNVIAEDNTGKRSTSWTETSIDCSARPPQFSSDGELKAEPDMVNLGQVVTVSWDTEYTNSCTVSDNLNRNTWTGVSGSHDSEPIIGQTVYTMTCDAEDGSTFTATTTVNIAPGFEEL